MEQNGRSAGLRRLFSGSLPTSILGSLIAGALLIFLSSAATVAVTNRLENRNNNVITFGEQPVSASEAAATTRRPDGTDGNRPLLNAEPSRPATTLPRSERDFHAMSSNTSTYFFDRQLHVAIGGIAGRGEAGRVSHLTLELRELGPCRFENIGPGRFYYKVDGDEYEVRLDLGGGGIASLEITKWKGRATYVERCGGENPVG
jgi:hypothetical protein